MFLAPLNDADALMGRIQREICLAANRESKLFFKSITALATKSRSNAQFKMHVNRLFNGASRDEKHTNKQ